MVKNNIKTQAVRPKNRRKELSIIVGRVGTAHGMISIDLMNTIDHLNFFDQHKPG
jgi:hypothetical protein